MLRALDALGIGLSLESAHQTDATETELEIDIDQIVDNAKGRVDDGSVGHRLALEPAGDKA